MFVHVKSVTPSPRLFLTNWELYFPVILKEHLSSVCIVSSESLLPVRGVLFDFIFAFYVFTLQFPTGKGDKGQDLQIYPCMWTMAAEFPGEIESL